LGLEKETIAYQHLNRQGSTHARAHKTTHASFNSEKNWQIREIEEIRYSSTAGPELDSLDVNARLNGRRSTE
jgi:hypothetical protein